MQANSVTRFEKIVDQAASVLFGVACGYSAFLCLYAGDRLGSLVTAALAGAVALITYLLSFRFLNAIKPSAPAVPVRAFRLHEVEPAEPEEFLELDSGQAPALLAAPRMPESDELLLTDPVDLPCSDMPEQVKTLLTESYEAKDAEAPRSPDDPEIEREKAGEPEELERSQAAETEAPVVEEDLVLDDLADFGPNSRVVRLFDAAAMPTPGQLGSRIDQHLQGEPAQTQSAEAAQALQDALAELRRAIPNRLR